MCRVGFLGDDALRMRKTSAALARHTGRHGEAVRASEACSVTCSSQKCILFCATLEHSRVHTAQEEYIELHTCPRTHTIPYHTIPYHTIPYHTIPYHTIPYHTIPYHTIPYHTIPYHTIPYHTIPYHTIQYNQLALGTNARFWAKLSSQHVEEPWPLASYGSFQHVSSWSG